MCCKKLLELSYIKKKVCVPRSFLVINVCNQGKTLCLPCRTCCSREKSVVELSLFSVIYRPRTNYKTYDSLILDSQEWYDYARRFQGGLKKYPSTS